MFSALRGRLNRPRHIRVDSHDDLTQLTQLTPRTPYGIPPTTGSSEYFDRTQGPDETGGASDFGGGDEQPLTGGETRFRRGIRYDEYTSPPLPTSAASRRRKSDFGWLFWIKCGFCAITFGAYVYL